MQSTKKGLTLETLTTAIKQKISLMAWIRLSQDQINNAFTFYSKLEKAEAAAMIKTFHQSQLISSLVTEIQITHKRLTSDLLAAAIKASAKFKQKMTDLTHKQISDAFRTYTQLEKAEAAKIIPKSQVVLVRDLVTEIQAIRKGLNSEALIADIMSDKRFQRQMTGLTPQQINDAFRFYVYLERAEDANMQNKHKANVHKAKTKSALTRDLVKAIHATQKGLTAENLVVAINADLRFQKLKSDLTQNQADTAFAYYNELQEAETAARDKTLRESNLISSIVREIQHTQKGLTLDNLVAAVKAIDAFKSHMTNLTQDQIDEAFLFYTQLEKIDVAANAAAAEKADFELALLHDLVTAIQANQKGLTSEALIAAIKTEVRFQQHMTDLTQQQITDAYNNYSDLERGENSEMQENHEIAVLKAENVLAVIRDLVREIQETKKALTLDDLITAIKAEIKFQNLKTDLNQNRRDTAFAYYNELEAAERSLEYIIT
jgi:hypothetical protein